MNYEEMFLHHECNRQCGLCIISRMYLHKERIKNSQSHYIDLNDIKSIHGSKYMELNLDQNCKSHFIKT